MDAALVELFGLDSKVAIVTGGARGIGRGIAEALGNAGAAVAIADVDSDLANSVAQELETQGIRSFSAAVDVADEASVKAMIDGVYGHFGRVDVLVNNAGIFPMKRLREMDSETWDRTLAVNLRGTYLCTRYGAERIIEGNKGGRIINISTINTARTYLGMAHYDSSKYGVNALTRASALEYASFNITVNAIAPGAVKTPGSLKVRTELGGGSPEPADAEFAKRIPLGRWAEPKDIGRAVLCLTGRAADYITGQIIYVDGGLMIGF
jgi:NAD(P)-dependent dehydrogenase (short-subunit alcohol dehydrogenase family)